MEHTHGPFAGLSGKALFKKMYRGNSQTYLEIQDEFFGLVGGQENIVSIEKNPIDKLDDLNAYLINVEDIEKTEFKKNDFCNRMINEDFIVEFHNNQLMCHVRGKIENDLKEFAKSLSPINEIETHET